MTKRELFTYITNLNGKIFTVEFTKKNGEQRKMLCRTGVKKYVKGIGQRYNPREKGLIGVYDLQKSGYRMINLETITSVKCGNKSFTRG